MKKAWKAKLLTAILCNLFLFSTVLLFSPMEVFIGNVEEFRFPFSIACQVMLAFAIAMVIVLTLVEMLLPSKVFFTLNALFVGIGICCYVQMMFLNGSMITMTGEKMQTTRLERIVNLGIWGVIILAILMVLIIMLRKKREKTIHFFLRYVSVALAGIQALALIISAVTTDLDVVKGFVLFNEGHFDLAPKNNTLVIIADRTENSVMEQILEDYPDVYEALSGFTYYRNATSMHSRTYPAISYLLTGEKCYYDKLYYEYTDEAFTKSTFLRDLKEHGVDSRVFSWDANLISKCAERYLANSTINEYRSLDNISVPDLIRGMLDISLYKVAPYRLKYELGYDVAEINQNIIIKSEAQHPHYDYDFYMALMNADLNINQGYDGAFRFYHINGIHGNMFWDENMNKLAKDEEPTSAQAFRGSLKIVEEYVKKLDEKGILDETTIILTADHGSSGGGNSLSAFDVFKTPPLPTLLVKYPDSDMSKPLQISNAPVCHDDLFATIMEGCGADASAYGRTLREIPEDEQRERYYYYTALYSDKDGEIALKEYRIKGDANDFANWEDTGKYWDVNYSYNTVSERRYADEMKKLEEKKP